MSQRSRRIILAGVVVAGHLAVSAFGLWALAGGNGSERATGRVVSVTAVATGKVVCVRDSGSSKLSCGEISRRDLPQRLQGVEAGGCAFIKVARGAAVELERRSCQ